MKTFYSKWFKFVLITPRLPSYQIWRKISKLMNRSLEISHLIFLFLTKKSDAALRGRMKQRRNSFKCPVQYCFQKVHKKNFYYKCKIAVCYKTNSKHVLTAVDLLCWPPDSAGKFKTTFVHPSNDTLSHELEVNLNRL